MSGADITERADHAWTDNPCANTGVRRRPPRTESCETGFRTPTPPHLRTPWGLPLLIENRTPSIVDTTPAPMRRGERRKQLTRRRLLDAAAETYAESGVEGATISAITERADVGLGTFYLHFEDKDAIAVAVSALVLRRLLDDESVAVESVRSVGGEPDPVAVLARSVCARSADTPGLLSALLRWEGPSAARDGAEADQVSVRRAILPHLADRFRDGMGRGLYRTEDPELAAHALLGVFSTTIPAFVVSGRTDWSTLEAFVERTSVSMFRR